MNGVHDMGGMRGMGPIEYEPDEPVFHTHWEARASRLMLAMGAWRKWNIDAGRHSRELIPAAEYLRMSYYEKWVEGLVELSVARGLVTAGEIRLGVQQRDHPNPLRLSQQIKFPPHCLKAAPTSRSVDAPAGFHPGDRVRAKNINPTGTLTCHATFARGSASSIAITGFSSSPTPTRISTANSRNTYIQSASLPASYGVMTRHRATRMPDLWESYLSRRSILGSCMAENRIDRAPRRASEAEQSRDPHPDASGALGRHQLYRSRHLSVAAPQLTKGSCSTPKKWGCCSPASSGPTPRFSSWPAGWSIATMCGGSSASVS